MPEIKHINIKSLVLLERNPRKITKEQMKKLCDSLQEDSGFFTNRPCLVHEKDGKLEVYAGNQRVRAAKSLGWQEVPCIVESGLSEKVIKDRVIKDNKTYGEFDYDILAADYEIEDLLEAGFTPEELDFDVQDLGSTEEDDDVLTPGEDKEAQTKLGDVYELNQHRIICGDSTHPDIVAALLGDAVPILMVTDPPYGVEYDPSWRIGKGGKAGKHIKSAGKVQNDDRVNWALAWYLFPGSIAYVWHASHFGNEVQKTLEECEFKISQQIIWAKQNHTLSRSDYHWKHEPCWYAVKNGHQHNWQGSRKESTIWEIASMSAFGSSSNEDEKTAHSTQKPIECMAKPIRNNTAEGEGVYDPFLGSGTTLIAAEQLNRICYGIELSPAYCDIIVNRWMSFMVKNNKPFQVKKNGEIIHG